MKLLNPTRAKKIIDQFSGKKILIIGDVMLDRYVFGKVERLNPEAPVPVLHAQGEEGATGGAGNTAKNVAALGGRATLVGVVGEDTAAQGVTAAAKAEGYEVTLIQDSSRPTTEKIRYIVNNQQMLRVDYEKREDIDSRIEAELMKNLEQAAADAHAIIVSDYAKGVTTKRIAETVLNIARERKLPLMADVKPSRAGWFAGATWLSPNRKEAHEFLGLDQFDNGGLSDSDLAGKLKEKYGATVFLTLSAGGMYVLGENEEGPVSQEHEVEVADTSGAGDTAAAAIVLAKLSGASDKEAAQLGNAAGAIVVSKVGAVGVTQEELLNMISHKHDTPSRQEASAPPS